MARLSEAVSEDISFVPVAADAERARACMMQRREAEAYRQMELENCRREKQQSRRKYIKWLDRLVPLFVLMAEAVFGAVLYFALFL